MSGGVDSSVAAALLVEQGHEVVGATLKLWGGSSDSGCCSVKDVDDARRVAQQMGISHHVFNYTEEFERLVVAPFVEGYAQGRSPNPCIECNRHVKFDLLIERAKRLGFDALATGHHAQVQWRDEGASLVRGADSLKDQSYVLGYLRESQLAMLKLPIGAMTKAEVRRHAERLGMRTWDKPDSQDVCFIEASKGREHFLGQRIALTPATFIDSSTGEELGTTPSAQLVTVGQRRGVEPTRDGERRFVQRVDLDEHKVYVGTLEEVMVRRLDLDSASMTFARAPLASGTRVRAQCSAHGEAKDATLYFEGSWWLELDAPARPVAASQSVVLYRFDEPDLVEGAALVVRP